MELNIKAATNQMTLICTMTLHDKITSKALYEKNFSEIQFVI